MIAPEKTQQQKNPQAFGKRFVLLVFKTAVICGAASETTLNPIWLHFIKIVKCQTTVHFKDKNDDQPMMRM